MTNNELFNYILQDEYWLNQAVVHFVLTAGIQLEYVEESFKNNQEND